MLYADDFTARSGISSRKALGDLEIVIVATHARKRTDRE